MTNPKFDIKKTQSVTRPTPVETVKPLTHSSLGIHKGSDGWYVVEVRFNPETKEAGDLTFTKSGLERETATELFRTMSVNLNIVG